ncbi:MAG: peptidoglycan-binding domain-containing protein [Nitratireductor sp.]
MGQPYKFEQIRDLLVLTGDLPPEEFAVSAFSDKGTRTAIRLFQKRHSIAVTGEMDDATLAAMAVPPSKPDIADTGQSGASPLAECAAWRRSSVCEPCRSYRAADHGWQDGGFYRIRRQ